MTLKKKISNLEKRQNEIRAEQSRRLLSNEEWQEIQRLLTEQGDLEKYPIYGYPCAANYHLLSSETRAEIEWEQQKLFGKSRK